MILADALKQCQAGDKVLCTYANASMGTFTAGKLYSVFEDVIGGRYIFCDYGMAAYTGPHPHSSNQFEKVGTQGRLKTTSPEQDAALRMAVEPAPGKVVSDGGATSYYELPAHATELRHLISHKGMSKSRGDIFKAVYRLGEKEGADVLYDLRKIAFFAQDLLEMHERGERL